ncbi:MAG: SDR family oxidoreductase [Sandaracinaceae bacterium]
MSRPARIVVTGASRGIGRAIARRLLDEGRQVALVARDEARLSQLAAVAPSRAAVIARDLVDPTGVIDAAAAALGGVDGLVHAAGVAQHAPIEAIEEEHLALAHALHVRAPFVLTRDLAAHLDGEPGSIVHVASTLGLRGAPSTAVYAGSKASLIRMSQVFALELAPRGVRVNVVAPGVVDTDMVRALRLAPGQPPPDDVDAAVAAQLEQLRSLHPLGRLGTPDDVAAAVAYLLDAEWVTGSVLSVDGGLGVA